MSLVYVSLLIKIATYQSGVAFLFLEFLLALYTEPVSDHTWEALEGVVTQHI